MWYKFPETPCQLETFSDTGQVAEEHAAAQQEDTQLQSPHQNVVQSMSCCGAQFSGSRIVRLSESVSRNNGTHINVQRPRHAHEWSPARASAETMGLISMYKYLGTHMGGVVLGDASAALATVARRGLGKLRHLDTNYLWIQQKAAKGDLNFKKVAGVDNGLTCSRRPCRGMRYRATSTN